MTDNTKGMLKGALLIGGLAAIVGVSYAVGKKVEAKRLANGGAPAEPGAGTPVAIDQLTSLISNVVDGAIKKHVVPLLPAPAASAQA